MDTYKQVTLSLLFLSLVALATLVGYSADQPACFPWTNSELAEPLDCYTGTGLSRRPNPKGKIQTISEMTARSGTTAELLSAVAALALASIYNALTYIKLHYSDIQLAYAKWKIVDLTFVVGSIGLVGLTVWNLRVESTVHTCFTSQTIVSICIQCVTLCVILRNSSSEPKANKKWHQRRPSTLHWIVLGMLIAMVLYVYYFSTAKTPPPNGNEYFAFSHHKHAIAQFCFFALYFTALMWVVYKHCGEPHKTAPLNTALHETVLQRDAFGRLKNTDNSMYIPVPQPGSSMPLRRGTVTRW